MLDVANRQQLTDLRPRFPLRVRNDVTLLGNRFNQPRASLDELVPRRESCGLLRMSPLEAAGTQ